MMTPEERAKKYLADYGYDDGHGIWFPEWADEDAVEWLVPLIRQAENDALERAAVNFDDLNAATARAIRALKHPD